MTDTIQPFLDIAGNEIHENAIVEMYHFTLPGNRKQFMYKQVVDYITCTNGDTRLKMFHLPTRMKINSFGIASRTSEEFSITAKDCSRLVRVIHCLCDYHMHHNLKKGNWKHLSNGGKHAKF